VSPATARRLPDEGGSSLLPNVQTSKRLKHEFRDEYEKEDEGGDGALRLLPEAEFMLDLAVKGVQRSLCYTPQSRSASSALASWGSRWR
jgi:hypothetical protein